MPAPAHSYPTSAPPRLATRWLLTIAPLFFLLAMAVAPVARLVWEGGQFAAADGDSAAYGAASVWALWQEPYLRGKLVWSFTQAAVTCVLALVLGVPVAWVLARWEFAGRRWVLRLLMLPFVVPTLVAAMGVLALWGPRGFWGGVLLGWGVNLKNTPALLLYGNLFFNLCLLVRSGVDALQQMSQQRLAAARSLGATPWRAFWRVEWPAMRPWLASALCLVFLYCFSGFGLALILGGQAYSTIEVEIYQLVAHELALQQAGILAMWMLLLTGSIACAYAAIERRLATPARVQPVPRQHPRGLWQRLALLAALGVLVLICFAPLAAIVLKAAQALLYGQGAAALQDAQTWDAVRNTLQFSGMALLLVLALGTSHALAVRAWDAWGTGQQHATAHANDTANTIKCSASTSRVALIYSAYKRISRKSSFPRRACPREGVGRESIAASCAVVDSRLRGNDGRWHFLSATEANQRFLRNFQSATALLWRTAAYLPLVISPVTVAFGLLLLYPQWSASLPLLLAAYALLAYPFVAKSLTAGLDSLPAHLEQAAASLGARPLRVLWRVTLPLVLPALRRGMAFAAATALGEFAVSLFLSRPEWTTLTTLIYQHLNHAGDAARDAAWVLSALLMLLALCAFTLIEGKAPATSQPLPAPATQPLAPPPTTSPPPAPPPAAAAAITGACNNTPEHTPHA